jgi:transcriptional regulator with XRE-family HTH domain
VGLPEDGRLRRVPGLRREELAQLAHVSTDYVVRLEQGRTRRVSRPVLDALADALALAADERAYLFTLADVAPPAPARRQPAEQRVDPQLQQLLNGMPDIPAMVLNRRTDVLAWNPAAAVLLADFAAMPPGERNVIRMTFLDTAYRSLLADWTTVARSCVAVLRREAGLHPDDPALAALVGELSVRDPDFRIWWGSHQVRGPRRLTKTFHHPVAGPLTLDVQQLSIDTQPDQFVAAYIAQPGSPAHEALRFLLQWSARTSDQDDRAADRNDDHTQGR